MERICSLQHSGKIVHLPESCLYLLIKPWMKTIFFLWAKHVICYMSNLIVRKLCPGFSCVGIWNFVFRHIYANCG